MHLEYFQCDNAPERALHFMGEEEETNHLMLLTIEQAIYKTLHLHL